MSGPFIAELRNQYDNIVILDNNKLELILKECQTNVQIYTSIQSLLSHFIGNGIEISYDKFGEQKKMSKEFELCVEREIIPFLKDYTFHILVHGFDVYTTKPSEYINGLRVPTHPRFGDWCVVFGWKNNVRHYIVLHQDTVGVVKGDYKQNYIFKEAGISVVYHPHEDGTLTSPLSLLLPFVQRFKNYWDDIDHVSYNLARPDFVVQQSGSSYGSGKSRPDPMNSIVTDRFAENDVLESEATTQYYMNEVAREQLEQSTAIASLQRKGYKISKFDQHEQKLKTQTPGTSWENPFRLPLGQQIARTTPPSIISQLNTIIDMILKFVTSAIGISQHSQIKDSSRTHSANAELDMRQLRERMHYFRNTLIPEIEKIFEKIWKPYLNEIRTSRFTNLQKNIDAKDEKKSKKIIKEVNKHIKVTISFKYSATLTTYERLKELRDEGIITDQEFSKLALKHTGLPTSMLLTEQQRISELKKRKRIELELLDMEKKAMEKYEIKNDPNIDQTPNTNQVNEDDDNNTNKRRKGNDGKPLESSSNDNTKSSTNNDIKRSEKNRKKVSDKISN